MKMLLSVTFTNDQAELIFAGFLAVVIALAYLGSKTSKAKK